MTSSVTVIIPVYNAVRHLELVLAGFSRQTLRDFELIVADDGSGPEMRAFVQAMADTLPFPTRSVYQADEGFRRSRILNRAIREATTGYLVFVDGDCVPHRRFLQAHWENRLPGTVLVGRRVLLSERISNRLTPQDILAGKLENMKLSMLRDALIGKGSHWDEGIVLNSPFLLRLIGRKEPSLLGSVCSLEKSLMEEINGFNEDFVGYGGEDTELEYRLRLVGARFKWVRHQAIQYHLYHPPRLANPQNVQVIEQTRARRQAACERGLGTS